MIEGQGQYRGSINTLQKQKNIKVLASPKDTQNLYLIRKRGDAFGSV